MLNSAAIVALISRSGVSAARSACIRAMAACAIVCGNGISKLVFTILSAVAENEHDRIGERIRDVKRHLAMQGVYGGGKRPFGFEIVDGRLVPHKIEQAAIARMQALRAAETPLREISATIAAEFNKVMTPMTVKRILDRIARAV